MTLLKKYIIPEDQFNIKIEDKYYTKKRKLLVKTIDNKNILVNYAKGTSNLLIRILSNSLPFIVFIITSLLTYTWAFHNSGLLPTIIMALAAGSFFIIIYFIILHADQFRPNFYYKKDKKSGHYEVYGYNTGNLEAKDYELISDYSQDLKNINEIIIKGDLTCNEEDIKKAKNIIEKHKNQ